MLRTLSLRLAAVAMTVASVVMPNPRIKGYLQGSGTEI